MWAYTLNRLILAAVTLFGISIVTFAVINLAPGDPALGGASAGGDVDMTQDVYHRLRERFHLNDPPLTRYLKWVTDVARMDFGRSFHDGRQVRAKIVERLPATLFLTIGAIGLSLLISIPLGLWAAFHAEGRLDRLLGAVCLGLYAVPRYVMAMVLIVIVSVRLEWLPFLGATSDGYGGMTHWQRLADLLRHSVLIGVCFVYPLVSFQVRFVRANALAVLGEDYIRAARAKGAGEFRVAMGHALPNVTLPLLTLVGLMLPSVLGGSVILEVIFSWPGMGRLMFESILRRDYPVVMALSMLSAVVVLLGTLVVDLLCGLADPRVRYR
jgi:peptide/nickel transport system permease protein